MSKYRIAPWGDGFELQELRVEPMTVATYYVPTGVTCSNLAKLEELCALLNQGESCREHGGHGS